MTNKNHPPKKTVKIISLKNDHDKKKEIESNKKIGLRELSNRLREKPVGVGARRQAADARECAGGSGTE